jgi:carbon storage regulator
MGLLCLTRHEGEAILLDGGIRIVLLRVGHGVARIGIDAPEDVSILRAELAGTRDLRAYRHKRGRREAT